MGAKAVSGTAVYTGGNERRPKHPCKYQPGAGTAFHHPFVQLPFPDRMYVSGAETADWSILLSFPVKTYAKTELLPENRGAWTSGAGERRKKPSEYTKSGSCYRNAYVAVLYCHGDTPKHFCLLIGESVIRPAALPKDSIQRKSIRGCPHGSSAEIFFSVYGKTAGITHNTNNSGTTG